MPRISVMNESKAVTDAQIRKMLPAFKTQWNRDLRQAWAVDPVSFAFVAKGAKPEAGTWWLVFLDDTVQAKATGVHDLTPDGFPIAKVFAGYVLEEHASVSVAASHELCEMAVDPWLNSAYQDPKGIFWAGEICDPVEADNYGYKIGDILVADFVTPNWFGRQRSQCSLDFKGHVSKAFQVPTGGYAQKYDPQHGWQQIIGPQAKRSRMAAHPVDGSRRERRVRQLNAQLKPSKPKWQRS